MKLSHIITTGLLVCISILPLSAGPKYQQWDRDFGIILGANIPMNSIAETNMIAGVTYGQFNGSGIGFRTGLHFTPNSAKASKSVFLPLEFAFRAGSDRRPFSHKIFNGTEFTVGLTPGYTGNGYPTEKITRWTVSDIEYWKKTWTECKNHVSLSVDAGACLNFNIWKFDLKLMPAFHYYLTDNFVAHCSEGNERDGETSSDSKNVKWFFSIAGGLVFKF